MVLDKPVYVCNVLQLLSPVPSITDIMLRPFSVAVIPQLTLVLSDS